MNFPAAHFAFRRTPATGFTLVEIMAAMGAAMLLLGAVVYLSIFTSRSFYMMGNYIALDSQSRIAVDILGREIRNSSKLIGYSALNPQFLLLTNTTPGTVNGVAYKTCSDKVTYDSNAGTLVLTITYYSSSAPQLTKTLLTQCDRWSFSLYNRAPIVSTTNIIFNSESVASKVKVINLSWKCSRTVFGTKFNTESVQTAQINLRNKTTQ
jgi:type II secretory pathway component PulJ